MIIVVYLAYVLNYRFNNVTNVTTPSTSFLPGGPPVIVIQYMPITALKTVVLTGQNGTWTVPADWNNLYNRIYGIGGGGGSNTGSTETTVVNYSGGSGIVIIRYGVA